MVDYVSLAAGVFAVVVALVAVLLAVLLPRLSKTSSPPPVEGGGLISSAVLVNAPTTSPTLVSNGLGIFVESGAGESLQISLPSSPTLVNFAVTNWSGEVLSLSTAQAATFNTNGKIDASATVPVNTTSLFLSVLEGSSYSVYYLPVS